MHLQRLEQSIAPHRLRTPPESAMQALQLPTIQRSIAVFLDMGDVNRLIETFPEANSVQMDQVRVNLLIRRLAVLRARRQRLLHQAEALRRRMWQIDSLMDHFI